MDETVRVWDLAPLYDDRPWDIRIAEASRRYGLKLEGLNLVPMTPEEMGPPVWPADHPFYLEPLASQGNSTAMVQLGIAFERVRQDVKALPWYEQAAAKGDAVGTQRLGWLRQRLATQAQTNATQYRFPSPLPDTRIGTPGF